MTNDKDKRNKITLAILVGIILSLVVSIQSPSIAGENAFDGYFIDRGSASFNAIPLTCNNSTIKHLPEFGNSVQRYAKIGDKIQACLLAIPARSETCNPDVDPRGRLYYIYDYRLKGAWLESQGHHYCGGA